MSARPGLGRLGLHQRQRERCRPCGAGLLSRPFCGRMAYKMDRRKFILQACHLLSGWRAFLLPTVPAERPKWHAWWIREAQKTLRSCVIFSFRRLATASAVCRGACCGIILA